MEFATKKQAVAFSGTLSTPSKMPGKSWGLEARATCPIGAKLSKVAGSVCASCYASKGKYRFANVINAHTVRLEKTKGDYWQNAMVTMIGTEPFFRWHDSGDLYHYGYLLKIIDVIKTTPKTQHWMPTHQKDFIRRYLKEQGPFPANLTVRLSAAMINGKPPTVEGVATSTVHGKGSPHLGHACTANMRGSTCGNCRKCWNSKIQNISYPQH